MRGVAVDNPVVVHLRKPGEHLADNVDGFAPGKRDAVVGLLVQGLTLEVLHHVEQTPRWRPVEVEDPDHVRMIDVAESLSF